MAEKRSIGAFLEERATELETRAQKRGHNPEELMRELPTDLRARVAKLATMLGLDALDALREDVTLDQLEEESRARDEASKQVESQMKELGLPF
jgi:hypothetical protein